MQQVFFKKKRNHKISKTAIIGLTLQFKKQKYKDTCGAVLLQIVVADGVIKSFCIFETR